MENYFSMHKLKARKLAESLLGEGETLSYPDIVGCCDDVSVYEVSTSKGSFRAVFRGEDPAIFVDGDQALFNSAAGYVKI